MTISRVRKFTRTRAGVLVLGGALACSAAAQTDAGSTETPPPSAMPTISVTAVAPQPGADLPRNLVPYNLQTATSEEFERAQALDATAFFDQRITGVTLNSAQGNPLQPNLQFRGFTATPLLGGAEGISVYVDGVRVNELFGDTVNWDLIPEEAMAQMALLSGANPVFGLNTLGAAILIRTKDGFSDPGVRAEAYTGSFGRSEATLESGGNRGGWGYYLLINHFDEDGWRDYSASHLSDLLGVLSWRGERTEADLRVSRAKTVLTGNGTQSVALLSVAPDSVFTAPDRTRNEYLGVTLQGKFRVDDATSLSATAFTRRVDTQSYNGDISEFAPCADDGAVLCDDSGSAVSDQHGAPVSSSYDATNHLGTRRQHGQGVSLQAVFKQPVFGRQNQLVAGVDIDRGSVDYRSELEASMLERSAAAPFSPYTAADTGVFLPDGALAVRIDVGNRGLFVTDTLSLTERWALTLSGRYNRTHTTIADLGGNHPDLNGDHAFHRFNPSIGATYQWSRALNFYASYSESTRAPTPVELTCASPDAPCRLPNEFLADPELKQVVAASWEGGLRGDIDFAKGGKVRWQAGLFRTTNRDDIVFQATGGALANEGFFANIGDTRRQGIEISFDGSAFDQRLRWYANFTQLDATFRTPFSEISAHHPLADPDTGLIEVRAGSRIPGLPRRAIKLGIDGELGAGFSIGGSLVYNSAQYFRGDEANLLAPIGGFARVDLRASYRFNEHVTLFARVDNVLDRRYANFGTLGYAGALYPQISDPRFVGPGAPRAGWVGVSAEL